MLLLVGLVIDERTLHGEVHLFLLIEGIRRTCVLLHALEECHNYCSLLKLFHSLSWLS